MRWLAAAVLSAAVWAQTPEQLLSSSRPADRAWGAWQAALTRDPHLRAPLREALRDSQAWSDAAPDGPEHFAVAALLDAWIQSGDSLTAAELLPFADGWRDEVLLLLARGTADEEMLLVLREQKQTLAQWTAVNNLLYRLRSARFFARTLAELEIGPVFEVRDSGEEFAYCGGAGSIAVRRRELPEGFPPVSLYRLEVEFFVQGQTTGPAAIAGPTDVFVQRVMLTPGRPVHWPAAAPDQIPGVYRERYLAAAAQVPQQQLSELLHPFVRIDWESAEQAAREMNRRLDEQAEAVRCLIAAAALPPGSTAAVEVHQAAEVRDVRRSKRQPLPAIAPRTIALP